jgi:hypothetical protein
MKRGMAILFVLCMCIIWTDATAKMGSGKVSAKSGDVNWELFGSLKVYPTYIDNIDFNDADTSMDYIIDESGAQSEEFSIRHEARVGLSAEGQNWTFLSILESDFVYNKANGDRGAGEELGIDDSGFTGEDFGLEKLDASYDFGPHGLPVRLSTGWNGRTLDIFTGGIVYTDDHPFVNLSGKIGNVNWDLLYLSVQEDLVDPDDPKFSSDPWSSDAMDWDTYSLRLDFPVADTGFQVSPFYLLSDNQDKEADVHYLGVQGFGKLGLFTPRAEFVYVTGEKDNHELANGSTEDVDISSMAFFAAIEADVHHLFKPFIGGYFYQGDDDANDGDIDAFNAISNNPRYSPVFGMPNAIIYRYVPALGSHLYDGTPSMLGGEGNGYGAISNSGSANSPGMIAYGIGARGEKEKLKYKVMFQYFEFENTGALEDSESIHSIDDEMGWEFDFNLTYELTNHFSLGNTISVFNPGNGIQDLYGSDYDETAVINTLEITWNF